VLLCTKQLYILDSYGVDGHWNDNELKAPIATRWRFRLKLAGGLQDEHNRFNTVSLLLLYKTYILLVANLSDFSAGILNVCLRKMFTIWFFSITIGNFCEEFENMPHRANIAVKCQVWCCSLIWRHISPSSCSGYCDIVHWLVEK